VSDSKGSVGTGVALKVAATLAFAGMNALIKASSERFGVTEIVFFRSVFAILVLLVWLWRRGELPHSLSTQRPVGHIGRSIAGSGGMFAAFIVLAILPLADATAFTFVTPLLVVPLAAFTLGEIVKPYRWAAVFVGFAGVLVMLSDHLGEGAARENAEVGVIVALIGALSAAVAMIQTRRLTYSEATGAIVFYFSCAPRRSARRCCWRRRCGPPGRPARALPRRRSSSFPASRNSRCWRRSACSAASGRS